MTYFNKFNRIIASLEEHEVEYALIGGYAVILYGHMRLTQDMDIMINPTDANLTKLQAALQTIYPEDDCIREITLEEVCTYPVIRYGTPDNFNIDIISHLGTAFQFSDLGIVVKPINGHSVHVASLDTLIRMKENTLRAIDHEDILFMQELQERIR